MVSQNKKNIPSGGGARGGGDSEARQRAGRPLDVTKVQTSD